MSLPKQKAYFRVFILVHLWPSSIDVIKDLTIREDMFHMIPRGYNSHTNHMFSLLSLMVLDQGYYYYYYCCRCYLDN